MRVYDIVDAHCDTLSRAWKHGLDLWELPFPFQGDLKRIRAGGVKVQFFAAFVKKQTFASCLPLYLQQVEFFLQQVEKYAPCIRLIRSRADLNLAREADQLAAVLALEGGEALDGDLTMLRLFYRLGARSLGLTWNWRNALADGVLEKKATGGLSDFGVAVIKEMQKLGMLIDVSHLAETGFWDVLALSHSPIIASHSNCWAVHKHPRNLKDAQLKALAQKGGVLGITLVNQFLGFDSPDLGRVLDHLEHAVTIMGSDHVGLGTDFDGVEQPVSGMEEASQWPRLLEALDKRGFSADTIDKILGKNHLRLLEQILPEA